VLEGAVFERYPQVGAGIGRSGILVAGYGGTLEHRAICPVLSIPDEWIFATPFGFPAVEDPIVPRSSKPMEMPGGRLVVAARR
jgi:hypothetical protein